LSSEFENILTLLYRHRKVASIAGELMNWKRPYSQLLGRLCVIAVLTTTVSVAGSRQGDTRSTFAELTRRATVIKPAAAELEWQQIPWLTDLARGQRCAREEQRPILLWVTGDDPLERC